MSDVPTPILLSWSGGKDCLMALAALRDDPAWRVVALLTTITGAYERVSMHGIRRDVVQAQAASIGLPLIECRIDWPSSNAAYEDAHANALRQARERWPGLRHCAFGDLFLEDVHAYRERQLAGAGWCGVFPLWGADTRELSRRVPHAELCRPALRRAVASRARRFEFARRAVPIHRLHVGGSLNRLMLSRASSGEAQHRRAESVGVRVKALIPTYRSAALPAM